MRTRELLPPIQALLALFLCVGMGWMLYTMALFDPTPPTAAEVHMLDTQDADVLLIRTAAAMTVDALLFGPTQILMPETGPSSTPRPTGTSVPVVFTLAVLPTQTATATSVLVPSATPRPRGTEPPSPLPPTLTPQPTSTYTPAPSATTAPTHTPVPTDPQPTATDIVPTATNVPPTATDIVPTATDVPPTIETPGPSARSFVNLLSRRRK